MTDRLTQDEREALSAFWDGELPPAEAQAVRERIERDPAWREAAEALRELDRVLDGYPPPAAPADLPDRILAALPAPRRRLRRWTRVAGGVTAAAAAVLLAVALAGPWRQRPSPPPGDATARSNEAGAHAAPDGPAGSPPGSRDEWVDAFAAENWDFCRDLDVLENYETLEALEGLERGT